MKKCFALALAFCVCTLAFAACADLEKPPAAESGGHTVPAKPVELYVVTTYGREDGNRAIYEQAYKDWAAQTGNTVRDSSASADEAWKAQVLNDFEAGSEPDVLFFYAFADGDPLVNGGMVVSIEEIRRQYPEYAQNMEDEKMPVSTADGERYCVPTVGFWEGLFVNNKVIAAAGVPMPGAKTTWDEFLEICQQIKDAGYTPIAMGREVPHYWFEFLLLNESGIENHLKYPGDSEEARQAWIDGLANFNVLYERGFLPDNYISINNDEARRMVVDGKAAFIGEGSWTVGWFEENANPNDITVVYPPGSEKHPASQIVGGTSMGYYITRKAWDNPAKRDAAVSFVMHMTSDEVVGHMSENNLGSNALKNPAPLSDGVESVLRKTGYNIALGATAEVGGAQDLVTGPARDILFTTIPEIAVGLVDPEAAVDKFIEDFDAAN